MNKGQQQNKKVLLIEPNYSNKYPPIGLMKLATYYKNRGGWEVVFFKGDLKLFVIDRIAEKCIVALSQIDSSIDWFLKKDDIIEYIYKRKKESLKSLSLESSSKLFEVSNIIEEAKNYYHKGIWKKEPEWDRVGITTLFTFYWDITIETIEFAKFLVKDTKNLMIGGVLASLQPKEIEKATGIKPWVGILGKPGVLDEGDTQIIDNLPLDYSILDEIEYKYPMSNAFYGYMTRGCIRHCSFCAVPTLEENYISYISLKDRIESVREMYGDQRHLLLMDNNVLASENFEDIINDIVDSGFGRGAKFVQPDLLAISIRNLKKGINDRAYIRKSQSLIYEFYSSLDQDKGDDSYIVYKILSKYHVKKLTTSKKDNLIAAYDEIKPIYEKHFRSTPKQRFVDFNQGVDARLFTEEKVKLLSKIAIKPLRIAFDDIKTFKEYDNAIRLSVKYGLKDFSNYLLYNFKDKPIDLYKRLKINVELCEELDISVYSFPMKYHPIRKNDNEEEDFSHNRDYIGVHWNRKYIRAIQAILNSTKGKVGRGLSFFNEAFGSNEDEYMELLEMPETFLIYRFFFKWLDGKNGRGVEYWRTCWADCMESLNIDEKEALLNVIHHNTFDEEYKYSFSDKSLNLLSLYANYRKNIITKGDELYELKKEYDSNPTYKIR